MATGNLGTSPVGKQAFGSDPGAFGLKEVFAESHTTIRVVFNDVLDTTIPELIDPSKYVLNPAVTVTSVDILSATTVRLTVASNLDDPVYNLTAPAEVVSYLGTPIDSSLRSKYFFGYPTSSVSFGLGTFGTMPYGVGAPRFGLQDVYAESPVVVRVVFNDLVDLANPALVSPASYTFAPATNIHNITVLSATSVRIVTDYLADPVYALTLSGVTSYKGDPVDPDVSTQQFYGFSTSSNFRCVAVSARKVRVLFATTMLENTALTDVNSYTITSLTGVALPITAVTPEGPSGAVIAVSLDLGADLDSGKTYRAEVVSHQVVTSDGFVVEPSFGDFTYQATAQQMVVDAERLGGVYTGGLLDNHNGLAFFSPSLDAAAPNSVMEVDDVSVCTQAYDKYEWPTPPDPPVFHVWSPAQNTSFLSTNRSLWAPRHQLQDAWFEHRAVHVDTVGAIVDGPATATLEERLDPTRVSFLNDPADPLYETGASDSFILADNRTPIPPGTTTVIPL